MNPNTEKGILVFLHELYKLSEKYLIHKKEYQKVRFTKDGMASQCLKGVFNYSHGKVYLAESKKIRLRIHDIDIENIETEMGENAFQRICEMQEIFNNPD